MQTLNILRRGNSQKLPPRGSLEETPETTCFREKYKTVRRSSRISSRCWRCSQTDLMSKLQRLEFDLLTRRPIAMEQRCREHRCAEFHNAPEMWSHHHRTATVYDGFHGSNGSENLLLLVVNERCCWRRKKWSYRGPFHPETMLRKIARKRFVDEMGGDASQSLRKLVTP